MNTVPTDVAIEHGFELLHALKAFDENPNTDTYVTLHAAAHTARADGTLTTEQFIRMLDDAAERLKPH